MDKKDYFSNYKQELLWFCEKSQGPHLPAKSMQPHHSPVVRAERPHRICQDFLQGEQDLLTEAIYKVPMSPVGATFSQENEAPHTGEVSETAGPRASGLTDQTPGISVTPPIKPQAQRLGRSEGRHSQPLNLWP